MQLSGSRNVNYFVKRMRPILDPSSMRVFGKMFAYFFNKISKNNSLISG